VIITSTLDASSRLRNGVANFSVGANFALKNWPLDLRLKVLNFPQLDVRRVGGGRGLPRQVRVRHVVDVRQNLETCEIQCWKCKQETTRGSDQCDRIGRNLGDCLLLFENCTSSPSF
jgi:hypothetical protein